jgi:hypothetical protein
VACRGSPVNTIYTFETWGDQLLDFMDAFVGEPAFLICNSVGGKGQALVDVMDKPFCFVSLLSPCLLSLSLSLSLSRARARARVRTAKTRDCRC